MLSQKDPRAIDKDATILFSQLKKLDLPKIGLNFLGSSPPELFVGKFNYPHVYTGILAPAGHDDTSFRLSAPEEWFKQRLTISDILGNRGTMVYSRFTSNVKKPAGKLVEVMQEVSMAEKPCDVEFFLKKKPLLRVDMDGRSNPVGNPAPLATATLTENPVIPTKVEYLVSDTDAKAKDAILELYKDEIQVSSLIKLLSAGLLGVKKKRTLVPSRWSVTAVDDMISKTMLEEIKSYSSIDSIQIFHDKYVGNYYWFVLLPGVWSFEVIEAKVIDIPGFQPAYWQDYESVYGRKAYADSVTGAYYANRLAVCEYLKRIKRQASVLVLREVRPEYYAPLGVGILREVSRNAFKQQPEIAESLKDVYQKIQYKMRLPVKDYIQKSMLIKERKEQMSLSRFL